MRRVFVLGDVGAPDRAVAVVDVDEGRWVMKRKMGAIRPLAVCLVLLEFRVACALDGDVGGGGFDLTAIIGGEFDIDRAEVFIKAFEATGAGDRDDPGFLSEEPGECDPRRCRLLAFGDGVDDIDPGTVDDSCFGCEAGMVLGM